MPDAIAQLYVLIYTLYNNCFHIFLYRYLFLTVAFIIQLRIVIYIVIFTINQQ